MDELEAKLNLARNKFLKNNRELIDKDSLALISKVYSLGFIDGAIEANNSIQRMIEVNKMELPEV